MNVQQFLKKNLRYVTIILLALFFLKSVQSCNRNMTTKKLKKEIVLLSDSLNSTYGSEKNALLIDLSNCKEYTKQLEYEVKLANASAKSANERADAIQSTASKIRENTTIKIEK